MVVIGWAFKASMFLGWVEHGLISVMSFLLLFCAAISLLVGALLVQSGMGSQSSAPTAMTTNKTLKSPLIASGKAFRSLPRRCETKKCSWRLMDL